MRLKAEINRLMKPKFILKKIESKMRLCGLIASEMRWRQRFVSDLRRGKDCCMNLASLIERIKREVELITGGGYSPAAAFTAKGDNVFKALDRIRYHITERVQFE